MTFHDLLHALGVDPTVFYAGGFGGALRALSRRRIKWREIIISPFCGMLAASYLTLPTVHFVKTTGWPWPPEDQQGVLALAFLIGTCAMWITDIVAEIVVRRFKPADTDS